MKSLTLRILGVIILAMSMSCLSRSQQNTSVAATCQVRPNADLIITVVNPTAETVYFICGMEQRINGEWREVVLDVSQKLGNKSARLHQLEPHRHVNFTWPRSTYSELLASSEGVFRVKVTPANQLGVPMEQNAFSEETKLNK